MNNECLICYENIISDPYVTKCNHKYHKNCLYKNFKYSDKCPYCQTSIKPFKLECSAILISGKKKGCKCTNNVYKNQLCKIHFKLRHQVTTK